MELRGFGGYEWTDDASEIEAEDELTRRERDEVLGVMLCESLAAPCGERCDELLPAQGYRWSSSRPPFTPGSKGIEAVLRSPIVVPLLDTVASGEPVEETNDERERRCWFVECDVDVESSLPRRPDSRIELMSGAMSCVDDTGEFAEGTLERERSEIGRLCGGRTGSSES